MAINLKVQGNFLVLTDVDSTEEIYRLPKLDARFTKKFEPGEGEDPDITLYTFTSRAYIQGSYKTLQADNIDFNDIIDDTTGSAFPSINDLDDFLCDNIGGEAIPAA